MNDFSEFLSSWFKNRTKLSFFLCEKEKMIYFALSKIENDFEA